MPELTGMLRAMAIWFALAATACADTPILFRLECPFSGESLEFRGSASSPPFAALAPISARRFGARPDGRLYGRPIESLQCPGDGLVLYRPFDEAEFGRLRALIASPEYRAMIGRERPSYLAAWLERALTANARNHAWLLLQASWQADDDPELKARYQREFIEAASAVPAAPDDPEWIELQGRAANALRELGRFDEARARLAALDASPFDVKIPEPIVRKYTLPVEPPPSPQPSDGGLLPPVLEVVNDAEIRDAEARRALFTFLSGLAAVIERRDPSSEPLDMMPFGLAVWVCMNEQEAARRDASGFCRSPEALAGIRSIREGEARANKWSRP